MNDIDLIKILEGCPKGTEFYHKIYGIVYFVLIDINLDYPILLSLYEDSYANTSLTKYGKFNATFDGECLLFPSKDQRDWSKFERFWDKPKVKKFDLKTLQPFDKVLVRQDKHSCWNATFFSHIDNYTNKASCDYFLWNQCIPYNDETKYLVGITDDCPEHYKWWEEHK